MNLQRYRVTGEGGELHGGIGSRLTQGEIAWQREVAHSRPTVSPGAFGRHLHPFSCGPSFDWDSRTAGHDVLCHRNETAFCGHEAQDRVEIWRRSED